MEESEKNHLYIGDKFVNNKKYSMLDVGMYSSKNGFNICGIGAMSTWYLENNNSLNKIEGKLIVFKSCVSDVKATLGNADKDTLMWVIYLLKSNCTNSQSKIRHGVFSAKLSQHPNRIGLSLVKITKVEDNTVFFEGLEGYMIDQTVVLEIVPFMTEYHNEYNIKGDTNQLQVKSNSPTQQQHNLEVQNFIQNGPQTKHILLKEEDCSETQPENFSDFEDVTFPDEPTSPSDDIAIENQQVTDKVRKQSSLKKENCSTEENFDLEIHNEGTNGSSIKYQCFACHKSFDRNSSLVRHVKIHSKENQYKCSICSKAFTSRITFKSHTKIHSRDKIFECKMCNKRFLYISTLLKHSKRTHDKEELFECSVCNEILIDLKELRRHNEKHIKKISKIPKNNSETIVNTTNNDEKSFISMDGQEASQSNNSISDYKQKKRTQNEGNLLLKRREKQNSFTCDKCLECFSRKSQITKHMESHRSHKCSICKKSFYNSEDLNLHALVHNRQYNCEICKKNFYNQAALISHKRLHTGEKPYQCSFCGKTFNQRGYLGIHMKWHTGEKPFECAHCSYACACKSDMITHMRTHTGEKPYCCEICGVKLTTVSSLARHTYLHTGERPYKCETCGKAYKSRQQVKIHGYSHTGEKPNVCPLCQSAYVKRGSLRKHMKRIHPGQENALPSKMPKWEKKK